jgi:hypothetical protein
MFTHGEPLGLSFTHRVPYFQIGGSKAIPIVGWWVLQMEVS